MPDPALDPSPQEIKDYLTEYISEKFECEADIVNVIPCYDVSFYWKLKDDAMALNEQLD